MTMQYFNFIRLIEKYSTNMSITVPSEDYLDEFGTWRTGESKTKILRGAIIRHRQSKIYRSEGTLQTGDRALYLIEKPEFGLVGTTIVHDNEVFRVESELNNSEYTGVWVFNLKCVSAFKEGDK